MELLFENYENFITENQDELNSPKDAYRLLNDDGMFRSYKEALTEGIDEEIRPKILEVLDRQREMLITEAANVGSSAFASGWTVMSFPVLVDIYADPLVSEVCTIYPVDKSIISIPRMRIRAVTSSYDGSTETSQIIPSATSLIRANEETVAVTPGTNHNIYSGLGFSNSTHKMNRRYTLMTSIAITETKDGGGTEDHTVSVSFRPDARNQISRTFTFTSSDSETVTGNVMANVNYDAGTATAQVTFDVGDSTSTFACDTVTFKLRFRPVGSNDGRTRVSVTTEMIDCVIDPKQHWGLC
jgi:hypothetical protein